MATIYHTREYAEYLQSEGFDVWHCDAAKILLWNKKRFFGLLNSFSSIYVPQINAKSAIKLKKFLKGKRAKISLHPLANDGGELKAVGFKQNEWATFLIDLSKSKEELFNNIDKSARKTVRRTLEKGVIIRRIKDVNEFDDYQRLMNENRRRNKVKEYPYSRAWWDYLASKGLGEVFVAELDSRLIGRLIAFIYNDYIN